jgi:starvation-inducible DNA-binding protein
MKNSIVKNLEVILASSYALTVKTQNYHWNVTGENFKSLHEMFGAQYEELFTALDEIAERVRALGSKVEAGFEHFAKISEIKSSSEKLDAQKMLQNLSADHKTLVQLLNDGVKTAQEDGDEGTADMLIGRLKAHEKTIWMIEATLSS